VCPKLCFICNLPGRPMYSCSEWSKDHLVADYFRSANSGLGFYHIDVPDALKHSGSISETMVL
jgi:hypothetical protein